MTFQNLLVEKRGAVSVVYLHRPEKLNTINQDLHNELFALTEALHEDMETRVVVLPAPGKTSAPDQI